jgi:N-acetylmuramoyl-L-alanine amidase
VAAERYRYASLLLEDLNSVPVVELGEEQYLLVIDAFQKVHRASPASSYCDNALFEAAQLYREMIGRFGPKPYQEKAVEAYRFLIHEYPSSKLLATARQAIDEIEKGIPPADLASPPPKSDEPETLDAVVEPAAQPPDPAGGAAAPAEQTNKVASGSQEAGPVAILSSRSQVVPVVDRQESGQQRDRLGVLKGVHFWSNPDYTRVVIELDDRVEVGYDQLPHPKRLFFDLLDTKLGASLEQESAFEVGDSFLRRIRVAQFRRRSTRIVFDLERSVYFDVAWLSNPPRLVVEVREHDQPALLAGATPPQMLQTTGSELAGKVETVSAVSAPREPEEPFTRALDRGSDVPKVSEAPRAEVRTKPAAATTKAATADPKPTAPARTETAKAEQPAKSVPAKGAPAKPSEKVEPDKVEMAKAAPPPPPPDLDMPSPKPASANGRGQRNLIRALGLKVNRVVIDAGHGGHDVGSSGPSGLREKDLVLDIALRLGKLIEEGLGSEVIYTRPDDTFISLKDRTTLANERQADLFISIHANSTRTHSVRGVETYYLNFTTDSWALTVASRENAASDRPVHELQDLISKIALKEKIDESREFATRVQSALYEGLSDDNKGLRDRGVRKAPFMVLIGAKMPAILAEIGFISNPHTEKLLKTSAYRQQVANHIYQGMLSYAESLGNVTMAQKGDAAVE